MQGETKTRAFSICATHLRFVAKALPGAGINGLKRGVCTLWDQTWPRLASRPPAPRLLQPLCEEQGPGQACRALAQRPASAAAARGPAALLPGSALLRGVEASSGTGLPLPSHRRMQVSGQPCQARRGASPPRSLWGAWSCSLPLLLWIPRALYAPGQSRTFSNLLPDLFLEHLQESPAESCISPARFICLEPAV